MRLVPELLVSDFERSLRFYTEVIGFSVRYARSEDRFAYLDREGAELMIEQTTTPERTLVAAEPTYPFGRGVNLQIETDDIAALYRIVGESRSTVLLPLEDRWYRNDAVEEGNRQFVVLDPDGYLLRFFESLGSREA